MTTWVLLRGLAREARHWGSFPETLRARLPADDAVLALDLPGNGAFAAERSPASVAGMVEAARRRLAELPHKPPYMLVALSLGGMVAVQWSVLERRKVAGCVLINSSAAGFSPAWQRLRPAAYATIARLLLRPHDAEDRERRILALTSNAPLEGAVVRAWAEHARTAPLTRANALRQLFAAARFRWPPGGLSSPTLLLASQQDRLVSVHCSRAMARAWNLPLHVHPSAGHDLPLDDPAWVAERIAQWHAAVAS